MAQSEQQRQRKLAKKQSKLRAKHKEIAQKQQSLASMAGRMQASAKGEIIYCGICGCIETAGIGHVLIARQGPSRMVGLAMFLIDAGCLGVKDCLGALRLPTEANETIKQLENERDLRPVAPGLARGYVEAAVNYARSLGFEPHADYRKASMIWGDIQAESIEGRYEFGRDGKPFYCSGPFDDSARQQHILRTLERSVGVGKFQFLSVYSDPLESLGAFIGNSMDDSFDDDDDDDLEPNLGVSRTTDAGGALRLDEPHS